MYDVVIMTYKNFTHEIQMYIHIMISSSLPIILQKGKHLCFIKLV